MSTALTVTQQQMPFADMERLGEYIAKSGLFGIKTKEAAIVLMSIAQAEGRHPVEAARDYDVVNNRPAKKAEAMMRDFIKAGGTIKWHSLTDELADATFTHPQTGEVRIDWDMKRAQTAFGKKDMYSKFPRQMLRSRVVSEGVRTLWPLATSGMLELGEASAIQPEQDAPTIDGTATDERSAINKSVPLNPVPNPAPRKPRTIGQLLDAIRIGLNNATSRVEVDRILDSEDVLKLRANVAADSPAILRLDEMRDEALERFPPISDEADELPEVEIAGAEKMASG